MSAFGRARRSVYMDADLVDLLKVAAPHIMQVPWSPAQSNPQPHTLDTLIDHIVRAWSEQTDQSKYADLLRMRNEAREATDRSWMESLTNPTSTINYHG